MMNMISKKIGIKISLDPVSDGVIEIEREEGPKDIHGLVIATNGDYKEVGAQEVAKILKGLAECFDVDCMGKTDFVAVYNAGKIIRHDGRKYVIGSVLIVKETGEGIELLSESELNQAINEFIGRLVAVKVGEASFAAYEIS